MRLFIIVFVFTTINYLQLLSSDLNENNPKADTTFVNNIGYTDTNSYTSHFNKYINLITYNNDLNISINNTFGKFSLTNLYIGSYLNINEVNTQDDELFIFDYQKELFKNLNVQFQQNYLLSSNSRDIGINQLSRLNGLIGINYYFLNQSSAQFLIGAEKNNILGIESEGTIYKTNIQISQLNLNNIQASANFSGDWLLLNLNRIEKELYGKINLFGEFTDVATILLFSNYLNLQNNLLYPNYYQGTIPYEIRNQNNWLNNLTIDYAITKKNAINLNLQIVSDNIQRNYNRTINTIDYSYLTRNIEQFELASKIAIDSKYENFSNLFTIGLVNKNEKNILALTSTDFTGDLNKLKNFENQKDYHYSKISLYNSFNLIITKHTSLQTNYSVNLIQYDTPSQLNFDDRDEYRSFLQTILSHKFSKFLNLSLTFENINNHLVFLFAKRSGLNNWNRIYRFSPKVQYKSKFLELNPQFEVLSNYTIYDFDNSASYTKSISLRNVGYSDSILIKFNSRISVKNQIKYQISERGIFFWHEFSEIPQISIHQFFIKSLLIRKYNYCSIGVGVNLFDYQQERVIEKITDHNIYSISPEVEISYQLNDWRVEMNGWYEFQTVNYSNKLEIPNLLIKVYINF